jgi:sugar/nucleoside kinase (ribokinase family)
VVNVARCEEDEPPDRLRDLTADAVYVRSRRGDLAPLLEAKAASALVVAHVPPVEPASRPAQVLVASASDLRENEARDPLALGRTVAGDHLRWIVITAGARGARALSGNEQLTAAAEAVETVDTTGAGDAFAAGLIHALVMGSEMADALKAAVRFGTEATLWPTSALPAQAVRRLLSPA